MGEILPVIAPLTIDPAHPFPFIANLGFGLFMALKTPKGVTSQALVMLSQKLRRFIPLGSSSEGARFISVEDCILLNLIKFILTMNS